MAPALEAFLLALSKSQGADPKLAAQYGGTADRNGEPFGETGMTRQGDAAQGDQNGGPRDPQGPVAKTKQDVRVSAGVQPLGSTTTAAPAVQTASQTTASAAVTVAPDASVALEDPLHPISVMHVDVDVRDAVSAVFQPAARDRGVVVGAEPGRARGEERRGTGCASGVWRSHDHHHDSHHRWRHGEHRQEDTDCGPSACHHGRPQRLCRQQAEEIRAGHAQALA